MTTACARTSPTGRSRSGTATWKPSPAPCTAPRQPEPLLLAGGALVVAPLFGAEKVSPLMSIRAAAVRRGSRAGPAPVEATGPRLAAVHTRGRPAMRYMVIVKANEDTEKGVLPTEQELTEMGAFNEELVKAGVMLAGEGLLPSSKGARVRFDKDNASTVVDGPFAETKELVAGFWILEVSSREEVIEWVRKAPFRDGEVEVRQGGGGGRRGGAARPP